MKSYHNLSIRHKSFFFPGTFPVALIGESLQFSGGGGGGEAMKYISIQPAPCILGEGA